MPMDEIVLQSILGTDRKNPSLSLLREEGTDKIRIYYGTFLLETVVNDTLHISFRTAAGRLYNAGLNRRILSEVFGFDRRTLRRWGNALKTRDPREALRILSGKGNRKMSSEIIQFSRSRFFSIYPKNHYSYSKQIRQEISETFDISVSSETLRPFFNKWKKEIVQSNERHTPGSKRLDSRDCDNVSCDSISLGPNDSGTPDGGNNHKSTASVIQRQVFIRHAGVCIFSRFLNQIQELFGTYGQIVKQWLCMLYLEAVNIEQSKYLDFHSLTYLLGNTIRRPFSQRHILDDLASEEHCTKIFKLNADLCHDNKNFTFYYDPHSKRYTGIYKILKGWCPSLGRADKVLHSDFIHSIRGDPLFMMHFDNFYDLRERYEDVVKAFRGIIGAKKSECITLVLDRAIFKFAVFEKIVNDPALEIITWEKDYKPCDELWEKHTVEYLCLQKYRNSSRDILEYTFHYIDTNWDKNQCIRRLLVRAINPNNKMVEVGVLTTDQKKDAAEIIRLIFGRWIQENDFKYLDTHYGINQITSYDTTDYSQLKDTLHDKEILSGDYKSLQYDKRALEKKLKDIIYKKHCLDEKIQMAQKQSQELSVCLNTKKNQSKEEIGKIRKRHRSLKANLTRWKKKNYDDTIYEYTKNLDNIMKKLEEQKGNVSKVDMLIQERYQCLNVRKKRFMDALRIFARNTFYIQFRPFRDRYDNFRDDHDYFRNLTHADGICKDSDDTIEIMLYPSAHLEPKMRKIIQDILHNITSYIPMTIDNSGRKLILSFFESETLEVANV